MNRTINRRQRLFFPLLATLCTLLVTGCGFHLRGTTDVAADLKQLQVSAPERAFQQHLSHALTTSGITITDTAPYRLTIVNLQQQREVTSRSGGDIVTDYQLIGTLDWQLADDSGLVLIPAGKLRQYGSYQQRANDINASQAEQDSAWNEVKTALVNALVRQLAALNDSDLQALAERAQKQQVREQQAKSAAQASQ